MGLNLEKKTNPFTTQIESTTTNSNEMSRFTKRNDLKWREAETKTFFPDFCFDLAFYQIHLQHGSKVNYPTQQHNRTKCHNLWKELKWRARSLCGQKVERKRFSFDLVFRRKLPTTPREGGGKFCARCSLFSTSSYRLHSLASTPRISNNQKEIHLQVLPSLGDWPGRAEDSPWASPSRPAASWFPPAGPTPRQTPLPESWARSPSGVPGSRALISYVGGWFAVLCSMNQILRWLWVHTHTHTMSSGNYPPSGGWGADLSACEWICCSFPQMWSIERIIKSVDGRSPGSRVCRFILSFLKRFKWTMLLWQL